MYGLMNLANIQAKTTLWNDFYFFLFVCFLSCPFHQLCLCVATVTIRTIAYVPCQSSLCAKSCTDNLSVQNICTGVHTHTHGGTRMPKTDHHYFTEVNQYAAHLQRLLYVVELSHVCVKVVALSLYSIRKCNSGYCFCSCVFCCHSCSICSQHNSSVIYGLWTLNVKLLYGQHQRCQKHFAKFTFTKQKNLKIWIHLQILYELLPCTDVWYIDESSGASSQ